MGEEDSGLVYSAPGTSGSERFAQGMNDSRTRGQAVVCGLCDAALGTVL